MEAAWNFTADEEVPSATPEGICLKLFCSRTPDGQAALDLAPRFRYIVRVSGLPAAQFAQAAAAALFSAALLIVPHETQAECVVSVVVLSLNDRNIRLLHSQPLALPAELEARRPAWTTQTYRRSPNLRPASPPQSSKRDSEGSASMPEIPPRSLRA